MLKRNQLFYFHILTFSTLPFFFYYGSSIDFILAGIVYFFMGVIGQATIYHRSITHKAFVAKQWALIVGCVSATIAGLGTPLTWAANHIHHHRFSDTPNDPHSPYVDSKWKIYTRSMATDVNMKYAAHLMRNKTLLWFHNHFWHVHLIYITLLLAVYPFGIISMYLAPAAMIWFVSASFNIYGHIYGYRNFETKDHSTNNWIIAIVALGEGWHNNHHKYPGAITTKVKWWEFDPTAFLIKHFFMEKSNESSDKTHTGT